VYRVLAWVYLRRLLPISLVLTSSKLRGTVLGGRCRSEAEAMLLDDGRYDDGRYTATGQWHHVDYADQTSAPEAS
jgi:hypothetical protein